MKVSAPVIPITELRELRYHRRITSARTDVVLDVILEEVRHDVLALRLSVHASERLAFAALARMQEAL